MQMETFIKYPAALCAGLLTALWLTPLWCRLAPRLGFVDRPGGRKIHDAPKPVGGGLAVILGFHAACAAVFLLPWKPFAGNLTLDWWLRFIPLSAGVALLGLLDDRLALGPKIKLAGRILIALGAYALDLRIDNVLGRELPSWADLAGTVLWFLALMNAFNLIDGVDGLASGIALIAACGMAVSLFFRRQPADVLLFAGFAGACLGFLRYNYYPARVFLGDTGSLFLGFTLAALAISTSSKGSVLAVIGLPILAVGVPLFDTLLAVWRRSVRRLLRNGNGGPEVKIDRGDADHLHHRLLRQGRRHDQVAWLLYGGTAFLTITGLLATVFHDRMLGILGIGFILAAYTVVRHLAWIELRDTGEAVLVGISRPVRRNLTLIFYLLFDLLTLNLAWLLAVLLLDLQSGSLSVSLKSAWLRAAPVDVVIPFLVLVLARAYSRTWSLARVSEYIGAGAAVFAGAAAACAVELVTHPAGPLVWRTVLHYAVMAGLAAPCIVGARAFLRVVQDLMNCFDGRHAAPGAERALVWGGGYLSTLYLRWNASRPGAVRVVGMVSSDDALIGHSVHGVPVLGGPGDLSELVKSRQITLICLAEEPGAEQLAALRRLPVRLLRWSVTEETLEPAPAAAEPRHG